MLLRRRQGPSRGDESQGKILFVYLPEFRPAYNVDSMVQGRIYGWRDLGYCPLSH